MSDPLIVELNLPQARMMRSEAKIVLFVGGIGSGKSFGGGVWAIEQATRSPGSLGLCVASTKEQLRDATLQAMFDAWETLGLVQGEHYVIGRRPPRHWGVPPWHPSTNTNILTWCWGGYLKFGSMDNFNSHRGIEPDYIIADEWRDWPEKSEEVLIGRLRGRSFRERGIKSQLLLLTSPPDDPEKIEQYFDKDDVEVIECTTYDNEANLPPDYISTIEDTYDEITFRIEVKGERLSRGGMPAAYSYVNAAYPHGNNLNVEFDPTADTILFMDYNAGQNRPMSWGLGQIRTVDGVQLDCVVMEFVFPATSTEEMADHVFEWLVAARFTGRLFGRGDHTGKDGGRSESTGRSSHVVVEQRFRAGGGWRWMGILSRRTVAVKDRVTALNARLRSYPTRRIRMVINTRRCPRLAAAFRKLKFKDHGGRLEENQHKDIFDALSYWPHYDHPATYGNKINQG